MLFIMLAVITIVALAIGALGFRGSSKQGRSQPINIDMAEVHKKQGITEKMLNFVYSQDLISIVHTTSK